MEHKPPFLIEYRHRGSIYSVHLLAPTDWDDAESHVRSVWFRNRVRT